MNVVAAACFAAVLFFSLCSVTRPPEVEQGYVTAMTAAGFAFFAGVCLFGGLVAS